MNDDDYKTAKFFIFAIIWSMAWLIGGVLVWMFV